MTKNEMILMAVEAASELTGEPVTDQYTQDVAFHLFCAVMAQEAADRGLTADDLRAKGVRL